MPSERQYLHAYDALLFNAFDFGNSFGPSIPSRLQRLTCQCLLTLVAPSTTLTLAASLRPSIPSHLQLIHIFKSIYLVKGYRKLHLKCYRWSIADSPKMPKSVWNPINGRIWRQPPRYTPRGKRVKSVYVAKQDFVMKLQRRNDGLLHDDFSTEVFVDDMHYSTQTEARHGCLSSFADLVYSQIWVCICSRTAIPAFVRTPSLEKCPFTFPLLHLKTTL